MIQRLPQLNTLDLIGHNHALTTQNFLNCTFCLCLIIKTHKKNERLKKYILLILDIIIESYSASMTLPSCTKKLNAIYVTCFNLSLTKNTGRLKKNAWILLYPRFGITNMLESWDIIHWKGGIHSFVWSTKTFLYDIWEPRYKQIKMGYQISKCLNIGQS